MPRTKKDKTTCSSAETSAASGTSAASDGDLHEFSEKYILNKFDLEFKQRLGVIESKHRDLLFKLKSEYDKYVLSIPKHLGNMTIGEIKRNKSVLNDTTFSSATSVMSSFTTSKRSKKRTDEGYSTTGSNRTASCDRNTRSSRSRTIVPAGAMKRVSRSASRIRHVNFPEPFTAMKTPSDKGMPPPNSYAFVTPKVKPNTPLTILRRPKQGEVAISMQGSPLMVGGIVTDTYAHVNIPMDNGSVLSLQPNTGLRLSELPELDEDTKRQLAMLRDNLDKMCKLIND